MNSDIPESIKEEIRQLRKEGHKVSDIYAHVKGKGIALTFRQCSAIASWAHPNLEKMRAKDRRTVKITPLDINSKVHNYKNLIDISRRVKQAVTSPNKTMNDQKNDERTSASPLENEASTSLENSTPWENNEGPEISKAEALRMLSEGYSPQKMAGYFRGRTESQYRALKSHIDMGTYLKNPDLRDSDVLRENGGEKKPIRKKEDFVPFITKNEIARDMSLLALTLGADGGQIEEAILELYHGKFKNREELHELLKETKEDIARLVQEGVTNLGAFLGGYSLFDRQMAPIILGGVTNSIPLDKVTPTLDEMLLRVANGLYAPAFNRDTVGTIKDLEQKAERSVNLAQKIYTTLVRNYQATLAMRDELNQIAKIWNTEHSKLGNHLESGKEGKGFAM